MHRADRVTLGKPTATLVKRSNPGGGGGGGNVNKCTAQLGHIISESSVITEKSFSVL